MTFLRQSVRLPHNVRPRLSKEAANRIADNPHIGSPRAEFREWPAQFGRSAYILRYHILPTDDALITRVWHSRELRQE